MVIRKTQPTLEDMLLSISDGLEQQVTSIYSYKPHQKQLTFHCSTLEEKLFIGGNRSGKTVGNIIECIWRLTKTHPYRPELNQIEGPIRGRICTVSLKEGIWKIILPLLKQWMPRRFLIGRSWEKSYSKEERTLYLADGSFLEIMSYEQDLEKFAGTSRHFCSFDEEPPKSIWAECLLRLVDTDGDWWISMTPVEGLTWTWEVLYEPWSRHSKPGLLVVEVSMHDNPHLSEKGKEKILANITDPEERAAREYGKYVFIKGLVYKDFDPGIHNRGFFIPQRGMQIWTSLDTGWRHPAAWLWHAVEPGGHITTFHEMIESEKTIEQFSREVLEWEAENLIRKGLEVYARTGDPAMQQTREATGSSVIGEYSKHGIYIGVEGVPKGPGSVDIGVTKFTQYLQTIIRGRPLWGYSRTPILEQQLKNLRWEMYESKTMNDKKPLKTTIDKKNDDGPDSLRYFITLMDDLTPNRLAAIQNSREDIPSPYYSGIAEKMQNDYTRYSSSDVYRMEN